MKIALTIAGQVITIVTVLGFVWWGRGQMEQIGKWKQEVIDSTMAHSERTVNVFVIRWESSETMEDSRLRSHEARLMEHNLKIDFIERDMERAHFGFRSRLSEAEETREAFLYRDSIRSILKINVIGSGFDELND